MSENFSLLWTAMPVELVLGGWPPEASNLVEVRMEGRLLELLPGDQGMGIVQRLHSTDPQDFLDPRWQPGARVPLFSPPTGVI